MQRVRMGLIEIHPEYEADWRAWGARLIGDLRQEAMESLKEEGQERETVAIVHIEERVYLCFLSDGDGLRANPDREVNKQHSELLERSRVKKISGETIYDLRTDV